MSCTDDEVTGITCSSRKFDPGLWMSEVAFEKLFEMGTCVV